jgi:hypothetical protein
MKVSGPTQIPSAGTSPAEGGVRGEGVNEAGHADEASGVGGDTGVGQIGKDVGKDVRTIDQPAGARLSEPASALRQPRGFAVADIAREVDAGKLSPQLALERVMDRVLDRHLDKSAPATTREHVRTALLDALDSDPLLAEKLAQLG